MDYLIFYKKNESLKDSLSKVRLNDSASYTQYFIKDINQLKGIEEIQSNNTLLFYFSEDLTENDKEAIERIQRESPQIKIVLFSDGKYALEAWSMDVLHFEAYPVMSDMLVYSYFKWQRSSFDTHSLKELTVKTDDGIHKILLKDIHYIQAAGNYTMIHHGNQKCLVVSRQLGTFSDLYENEPNFCRVHRSIILHCQNVSHCQDTKVHFRNGCKPLQVTPLLETKIKKLLLQKR